MKKQSLIMLLFAMPFVYAACSDGGNASTSETPTTEAAAPAEEAEPEYNPHIGEGKYDSTNVNLGALDKALATKGKAIAETKCFSCHKTTDEKLVGPGWKDVTKRRSIPWLMNFISDPDPMIDKDPAVQEQLDQCLVRMPNQNLAENETKEIVEFMRQNDGAK